MWPLSAPQHPPSRDSSRNGKLLSGPDDFSKWGLKEGPSQGKAGRRAPSAPAHSLDQEGQSSEQEWGQAEARGRTWLPTPPQAAPPACHSQLLVEPGLAAGLEVANDNAELPDVLHKLLQVLFQVVELLRQRRAARTPPRAWSCPLLPASVGPPPLPASSGGRMGRSLGRWARPPWRGMGVVGRGAGL